MSFNFSSTSSSSALSFRPETLNVEWDGVSDAKAIVGLACWDSAASYSAVAYPVYSSSGVAICNAVEHAYTRGQRVFSFGSGCQKIDFPNVALPVTAANATAAILFSAITSVDYAHAWRMTATKGTSSRAIIEGRVTPISQNPYVSSGGPTVSLVSGVTASGCFS